MSLQEALSYVAGGMPLTRAAEAAGVTRQQLRTAVAKATTLVATTTIIGCNINQSTTVKPVKKGGPPPHRARQDTALPLPLNTEEDGWRAVAIARMQKKFLGWPLQNHPGDKSFVPGADFLPHFTAAACMAGVSDKEICMFTVRTPASLKKFRERHMQYFMMGRPLPDAYLPANLIVSNDAALDTPLTERHTGRQLPSTNQTALLSQGKEQDMLPDLTPEQIEDQEFDAKLKAEAERHLRPDAPRTAEFEVTLEENPDAKGFGNEEAAEKWVAEQRAQGFVYKDGFWVAPTSESKIKREDYPTTGAYLKALYNG